MLWFCYFIQHTDILEAMLNERYMGYRYGSSQASFETYHRACQHLYLWCSSTAVLIHRPNERLLFHPPGTPRCVCVSGCQSHRSHVKLWLLFVREPVNRWEANHCRCAPTWHQKRESLQAGSICLCPPSRGCISLFWDIHARIPHSYSGSPRAANGFPFVARPFCLSCCCETRTDYSALVYSHEEE